MDRHLYKILCENDLAEDQVIVALTSRDICCVSDFLERGEDALKDMRDKYTDRSNSWSCVAKCYSWQFPEYRQDDIKAFKLITVVQAAILRKVLETLRDANK